jgi:hypothetical protein
MVMGFVKGSEIACRNKGKGPHPRGTQRNSPNLLGPAQIGPIFSLFPFDWEFEP